MQVLAELVLSEGCERESVPIFFPSFGWLAGDLWYSLACRYLSSCLYDVLSLYVHVYVQISSFYKNISYIGLGAHPIPV